MSGGATRVAILGSAHPHAVDHARSITAPPHLDLAAVSEPDPGRARPVTGPVVADPVEAAASADVVVVDSQTRDHAELAGIGVRSGAAVFVEKPLGRDPAETRQVAALLDGVGGGRWATGAFLRALPVARRLRRTLDAGDAGGLGHDYVGTEHLLLGLLKQDQHTQATDDRPNLFSPFGVTLRAVRDALVEATPPGDAPTGQGHIPLTLRSRTVLVLALRHTHTLGHHHVEPRHLLLGLLTDAEGLGAHILTRCGVDLDQLAAHARTTPEPTNHASPTAGLAAVADTLEEREPATLPDTTLPGMTSPEPALLAWLHDTIYSAVVHPDFYSIMNNLALSGPGQRVPAPPDDVLVSWHRELARLRTTRLQSELGFLDAAARSGWSEDAISAALAVPDRTTIAEHRTHLEAERDYHNPSQHPRAWTG